MTQIIRRPPIAQRVRGRTETQETYAMNKQPHNTHLPGDFISEQAVRGVLGRRAADQSSRPASRPRQLRRWSVAELVARSLPNRPAGGVAH